MKTARVRDLRGPTWPETKPSNRMWIPMGYYTALHVDCIVKPEHAAAIAARMSDPWEWDEVARAFPDFPLPPAFLADGRRDFIPNGGNGHMPDGWHDAVPGSDTFMARECEVGDSKSFYDPETRRWAFACTLKNYDNTIDAFLDGVLAKIAESVAACETEGESGFRCGYSVVDGVVTQITEGHDPE